MASVNKNLAFSNSEYTRLYDKMRGICAEANSDKAPTRFGMLENMYVDYEGAGEAVESIPGFRRLMSCGMNINGIYEQKIHGKEDYIIIHAGKYICRFKKSELEGTVVTKAIAVMKDAKSASFCFGNSLYIIDGESMLKISEDGGANKIGGDKGIPPYIPTMYRDGKPYEKRNLLSRIAWESYTLNDPISYSYGSPGLKYLIMSERDHTCVVIGSYGIQGELHIPTQATIDDKYYTVVGIGGGAFRNNTDITALITNSSLLEIGDGAFAGCTSLEKVILSYTVNSVGEKAFKGCSSLSHLHFNLFPLDIGADAFSGCDALSEVKCTGDIESYEEAVIGSGLESKTPISEPLYEKLTVALTAHGNVDCVIAVWSGSKDFEFVHERSTGAVIINFENESAFMGKEIIIKTQLLLGQDIVYNDEEDFLATDGGILAGGTSAIMGCTVCEAFDGRIFLSGHPLLPGVVFYSDRDKRKNHQPLYFSSSNFFVDGIGNNPVTALLTTHGSLAVFKENDDGSGTILYHEPKKNASTGETTYPVSYAHGSIPGYGCAANFFDEPLFLTEKGVCALEKTESGSFKEVKCRSELISPLLISEDLKNASVTKWQGYLVVATGSNLYLADSRDSYERDGILQYEWYRLTGIGTYKNDTRVYRYSEQKRDGYDNHPSAGEVALGEIYSEEVDEETVYFLPEGDKKWLVYKTDEYTGGDFDPCSIVFSDGNNLYFGTKSGDICMFNTDKRGVAPEDIASSDDFDEEEYRAAMGNKIHPAFYSFDRHAASYGVTTVWDNCDLPHLTKNSVRNSMTVKFKTFGSTEVTAEVETDNGGRRELGTIPLSALSFESIDFSGLTASLSEYSTVPIPESEKDWTDKRLSFHSNKFCSPFGVYSISYRYKIKGTIK